jgi:stage III sporulation protein AH
MKIATFKLTTVLIATGLVLALAVGGLVLVTQWHSITEAEVDRSNAIQVAKPIQAEQVIPVTSPDFFTEYRLERDKIRSERSDLLRESIKSTTNNDARQKTQDVMLKMVMEKQRETEIESLVKSRGFSDVLVFIKDNSVSVVLKTSSLSREDVLQVAEIISRVAGVKAEDITISAKP